MFEFVQSFHRHKRRSTMHVSQQTLRRFSYAGSFMLVTIGWLLYAFNDKISQQEQSGWSTSDASIWRWSLGASTSVWRIEIEYDVPVSKSWGIVWLGSESRRLEHNRFHHTRLCCWHAEGSTRQNQLCLPDAAQAALTVEAAARFFCIVWHHNSLIPIKISGLLSRSGRQCFSSG